MVARLIAVDYETCTGCRTCEVVCSLYHFGECNPRKSAIRVIRKEQDGLPFCLPLVCQQCEPAPCIDACATGALWREQAGDTLTIDEEKCNACGSCVDSCPASCISINDETNVPIVCDLCGSQPQCVAFCHSGCLTHVYRDDVTEKHKIERLAGILDRE
ncbi:4Fe-4S dicluster domain-containing protein, partial [Chloroflexota bacterium]